MTDEALTRLIEWRYAIRQRMEMIDPSSKEFKALVKVNEGLTLKINGESS